jgi:hypothetical protein
MIKILDSVERNDRTYHLADTEMGRIVYYQFSNLTQWKNLTNGDVMWTIKLTEEFEQIHKFKPVELFVSKRRMRFFGEKVKVKCGDHTYWLAEPIKPDGYLYEIPVTDMRVFAKKNYPDLKFPFTRYRIQAVREMDYMTLCRIKREETVRYNGGDFHSERVVSDICDAVYDYCKTKEMVI